MEVQRVAHLADDFADPVLEHHAHIRIGGRALGGHGCGRGRHGLYDRLVLLHGRLLGGRRRRVRILSERPGFQRLRLRRLRGMLLDRAVLLGTVLVGVRIRGERAVEFDRGLRIFGVDPNRWRLGRDRHLHDHRWLDDGRLDVRGSRKVVAREHRTGLDERDAAALGDLGRHRLQATADDARETADPPLRDRHVRETAHVEVQHALAAPVLSTGRRAVQRADQCERREIDALGPQPGLAHGAQQTLDHLALRGHDDHALARLAGRIDDPQRVEVQGGLRERHRDLILSLEAHRRRELLAIGDRRQLEHAQHGALVGEPDAHPLAETALREQVAQRVAERALVEHLALAQRVGRQGRADGALHRDGSVDVRLHGRDVARLDVQADDPVVMARTAAARDVEVGF